MDTVYQQGYRSFHPPCITRLWFGGIAEQRCVLCSPCGHVLLPWCNGMRVVLASREISPGSLPWVVSWHPQTGCLLSVGAVLMCMCLRNLSMLKVQR